RSAASPAPHAAARPAKADRHVHKRVSRRSRSAPCKAERGAPRLAVGTVDARDLAGRHDVLSMTAPGELPEGRKPADAADGDEPPDVPDQRKAHEGREEGANKAGRRVAGHLDVLVVGLALLQGLA